MELMATPRASAISPISGAAVPEEGEIVSIRVCALLRCNSRDVSGPWNAARGDLTRPRCSPSGGASPREGKSGRFDRESREASFAGGRRSGKLRAKLITDRLVETTGVLAVVVYQVDRRPTLCITPLEIP